MSKRTWISRACIVTTMLFLEISPASSQKLFPSAQVGGTVFAFVPLHDTLYAATAEGVFLTADTGKSWSGPAQGTGGNPISKLAGNGMAVFAASRQELYRSSVGGAWARVCGSDSTGTQCPFPFPIDDMLTIDSSVFIYTYNGVFRTEDDGKTWSRIDGNIRYGIGRMGKLLLGLMTETDPYHRFMKVLRTLDQGDTWDTLSVPQISQYPRTLSTLADSLLSVCFEIDHGPVGDTSEGKVCEISRDTGKTWVQSQAPWQANPSAVEQDGIGYLVDHRQTLFRFLINSDALIYDPDLAEIRKFTRVAFFSGFLFAAAEGGAVFVIPRSAWFSDTPVHKLMIEGHSYGYRFSRWTPTPSGAFWLEEGDSLVINTVNFESPSSLDQCVPEFTGWKVSGRPDPSRSFDPKSPVITVFMGAEDIALDPQYACPTDRMDPGSFHGKASLVRQGRDGLRLDAHGSPDGPLQVEFTATDVLGKRNSRRTTIAVKGSTLYVPFSELRPLNAHMGPGLRFLTIQWAGRKVA